MRRKRIPISLGDTNEKGLNQRQAAPEFCPGGGEKKTNSMRQTMGKHSQVVTLGASLDNKPAQRKQNGTGVQGGDQVHSNKRQ